MNNLIIKKSFIFLVETGLKLLWILPMKKNKIMFVSFSGQYSDSPKYLYKKLVDKYADSLEYVWVLKADVSDTDLNLSKRVQPHTLAYFKELLTSKIIITNDYLNTYAPIRKKQFVLNTWHGGSPLKTVGMVNDDVSEYDKYFFDKHEKKYNAYISSSKFMTKEVFRRSFNYKGEIIKCGLPRNAILFGDHSMAIKRVQDYFHLPHEESYGIVLYAPTFRGNFKNSGFLPESQQFNIDECLKILDKKFGKKFYFLFRAHHTFNYEFNNPHCLKATDYPDMQELLCAADILLTDYSSCMGDMCLMDKPVFLYTPDLEKYISDRGFYWDIFSLPFPVARNPEKLYEKIKNFDQENYREGIKDYLQKLGSYENPSSVEIATKRIEQELGFIKTKNEKER